MGYLRNYIKTYWKLFCVAVLFLTIEAVCDLLQPTIMSHIIDSGVATRNLSVVLHLGGLMLLVTAIGAIGAVMRNIISSRVSQSFGAELRGDLFRKTQSLSFSELNRFDRASLITRLTNDVTFVQMFVNGLMRIFVKAPLVAIGSLVMAIRLDPHLSVILIVIIPVVAVLIIMNMQISFPFFIKVQQGLDRVNGVMREYLSGVRVVKAFNRFDYEVEKFGQANETFQQRSTKAMRIMSIFSPSTVLVLNIGILAVLWIGGLRVGNGQMHVGHIVAFINYMTQILFSLMMISMIFNMFVRFRASAGRIGEVMGQQNSLTSDQLLNSNIIKGQVEFDNVSFSYKDGSGSPVIKNISFRVLPGQTIGIIGSTGSGKSSLIHLIPRFYDPVTGVIRFNGEDISQINPHELREKIAIVPQKTMLFSGTVLENIRWGKEDATMEEVEEAARIAEAHPFIMESPEGYETRIGQGGVNFSGGQKQRLSIARALVKKPELLILDDCTSAVDVATEARIKSALKTYAKDLTCILIAQRITSVIDADTILVMDNGEIAGLGPHEQLIKDCRVYQEIFESQMGKEESPNANTH